MKAVLFDLDGTLYDQGKVRRGMLMRLARAYWLRPKEGLATVRALRDYRKAQERLRSGAPEGVDLAEAQFGGASDNVRRTIRRWMEQEPLGLLKAARFSGVTTMLDWARERGIRLGVVSDYPAEMKLEKLGLSGYFDVVVSAQDTAVQRFKPDPSGLLVALERLRVEAHEAIYIGDRAEVDGAAARAAGMTSYILGAKDGFRCYEELINKLSEPDGSR